MARFEYTTRLACSRDGLFDFLLRPANVMRVSDPQTGLNIVKAPEIVEVGSQIEFQLIGFGQLQGATHEIVELSRPDRIVEVQLRGPLRSYRHEHLFEPERDGVLMVDTIEFEPPGGLLGLIANADRIIDQFEQGFFARQQQLERLVASGELA